MNKLIMENVARANLILQESKESFRTNVHNYMEAKVLTKEWDRDGMHYGQEIVFRSHEGNYIATASWDDIAKNHKLSAKIETGLYKD